MNPECGTPLDLFDSSFAQLLIVNNSYLPLDPNKQNRLCVLHQATIAAPKMGESRVINSVQIAPVSLASEKISPVEWEEFLTTDRIQGG